MDRWTGVLKIQLYPDSKTFYEVAASLALSSSPKNLAVPSGNAILFCGDRVEETDNSVIKRLSNPQTIAEILVSKFGGSINAYVIEASTFNGPFAVYKDLVPSVNENGEPKSYDAAGFPTSASLVILLSKFLAEAKSIIWGKQKEPYQAEAFASLSCKPKMALLGFSKGGIVLNQFLTELAFSDVQSTVISSDKNDWIIPTSKDQLLNSITEIHFVDVGLNSEGAYLTDKDVIDSVSERLIVRANGLRILLHGTPRQWCDEKRIWIRKEKNTLVRLLQKAAHKNMGKLQIRERLYFPGKAPDLQMHFEIIDVMDVT